MAPADLRLRVRHLEQIRKYQDASFDELFVTPVGPNELEMIEFYRSEILPRFDPKTTGAAPAA